MQRCWIPSRNALLAKSEPLKRTLRHQVNRPKAKCKAKAAPKPKPKAKASGKAKSKKPSVKVADANEQPAADHQQEPAIGLGRPPCPSAPGLGTTHFRGGKIQYPKNGKELRVFRKVTDRNDRKVKIHDGCAEAAWEKALSIIEDANDVD